LGDIFLKILMKECHILQTVLRAFSCPFATSASTPSTPTTLAAFAPAAA
jgi:hypothetical protein